MAGANDGSADSSIKEDENEARECFAMFDEDSDGFINKSQLPVLLMSLGSNPTQREMKEMMGTIKFKRRDKVSCNEFLYILQKLKLTILVEILIYQSYKD